MRKQFERRQFIRVKSRLTMVFKVRGTTRQRYILTRDIGSGGAGVCFLMAEALRPDTVLEASLKLPDHDRPIAVIGKVLWNRLADEGRKSYQEPMVWVGVKFETIDPKDRLLLVHYAKTNALPASS